MEAHAGGCTLSLSPGEGRENLDINTRKTCPSYARETGALTLSKSYRMYGNPVPTLIVAPQWRW